MSPQSMEMMIDVSSDISQLITSYPIDSLPRYPALLFQQMDFVPCRPSSPPISFPHVSVFHRTWTFRASFPPLPSFYTTYSTAPGAKLYYKLKPNNANFRERPTSKVTLQFAYRSGCHCSYSTSERAEKGRNWKRALAEIKWRRRKKPQSWVTRLFEEPLKGNDASARPYHKGNHGTLTPILIKKNCGHTAAAGCADNFHWKKTPNISLLCQI